MTYVDSLFSLTGRVALVTGAARGNGAALAEALLRAGATVVLVDILEEELEQTVQQLEREQLDAHAFVCDVTNDSARRDLFEYVRRHHQKLDVLVNNAGVTFGHDALTYPEELWEKTYAVNLKAPFKLAQFAARLMKKGGGSIINITSLNAEQAFPDNPAYVAFKGGLRQLTRSLALDLARYGIRANNIGPGYFRTSMTQQSWNDPEKNEGRRSRTALGRWGESEDLAGTVIFLASDASSYVTGTDIYVDGGWLIKGL